MEINAAHAHGEDPATWSGENQAYLQTLIKAE